MNQEIRQLRGKIESISGATRGRSLLADLRASVPHQILGEKQAKLIAEKLAQKMRARLELEDDFPFPSVAIEIQPRIEVSTHQDLQDPSGHPQSGLSGWHPKKRKWIIAINGTDHPLRQRFTLMHEYAHVVLGSVTRTPSELEHFLPSVGTYTSTERLENLCDQFAACLLMPRPLMKRAWTAGHQDVRTLARLFGTSRMATRYRLHDIGLVEPVRRSRPYFGGTMHFRDQLPELITSPAVSLGVK